MAGSCMHSQGVLFVALPGHLWDRTRLGSWQQSGPGRLSCPLGWTCATGARSSRWLGRSSSECGCVWSRLSPAGEHTTGPRAWLCLTVPAGVITTRRLYWDHRTVAGRGAGGAWTFSEPSCGSLGRRPAPSSYTVWHREV